ncbi:hypothetical protein K440DRAFT_642515 [Wilcoxina mikolae CBS 423.85]|nr:hypothetical protein K440DRAFT_642515 [Wilcoxina mikolae CBS 423.85]
MWSSKWPKKYLNEVKREAENLKNYWRDIWRTIRLPYNDKFAALSIVTDLLGRHPTLQLVQQEMLQPPHTVESTTVGRVAMPEGRAEAERLQKAIEEKERQQKQEEMLHEQERLRWEQQLKYEKKLRKEEEERRQ